jgi:hypothetical protein
MALSTARYADYFRSAPDPYGGDCAAAFAAFLPPGPPSAAQLFETMGQPDSSGAFAYLGPDTRVHVLHSLRRHTVGTFGQAPSPFAASTFAIRGERTGAGATYVLLEPAWLDEVQANHVRSAAEIAAGLLADPTVAQLAAETTGGDALMTRSCILVPHCYVSPLLEASATRGDGLEPREFWSLIETFMAAPEYQATSEPFVDWARIALSQGAGRANPLQVTRVVAPALIALDASLGAARTSMELAAFPNGGAASGAATGLNSMVATLAAMRADAIDLAADAQARRDADRALKGSPAQHWGESLIKRLRNLCQVRHDRDLPPIYRDLAEGGSKQYNRILNGYLRTPATRSSHNILPYSKPVASQAHSRCLGDLDMGDQRDRVVGLLVIFMISFPDQESTADVSDSNRLLDQYLASNVMLSLNDIKSLNAAQTTKAAKTWGQLRKTLVGYHRLQQALLGEDHPVPRAFRKFVMALDDSEGALEKRCFGNPHFCVQLLRVVQLATTGWVADQTDDKDPVDPPDYRSISDEFYLGRWVVPDLPAGFESTGKAATVGPRSQSVSSASPGSDWVAGAKVLLDDAHKTSVFDPSANVGAMVSKKQPSKNSDGKTSFCLSYHVKGECVENCRRKADHRAHSAAETKSLTTYLTEVTASA